MVLRAMEGTMVLWHLQVLVHTARGWCDKHFIWDLSFINVGPGLSCPAQGCILEARSKNPEVFPSHPLPLPFATTSSTIKKQCLLLWILFRGFPQRAYSVLVALFGPGTTSVTQSRQCFGSWSTINAGGGPQHVSSVARCNLLPWPHRPRRRSTGSGNAFAPNH